VTAGAPRALRLAHRGDWRVAPENSLAAMAAALAVPTCDGLEFDVRGSADGVPVLLHDATLERVQGLDARVGDLTAAELGRHGIPTLADVLAAAGSDPFLDVELKGMPVPAVIDVLEAARGPRLKHAVVSSFDADALEWLGRQRPGWQRWLNAMSLAEPWLRTARELGCAALSVRWTAIDEAGTAAARAAGLGVAAWTVRDAAAARQLDAMGVMAICVEAEALDA